MEQLRAGGDHPATVTPHSLLAAPRFPALHAGPAECSRGTPAPSQTLLRTKGSRVHAHLFAVPHELLWPLSALQA